MSSRHLFLTFLFSVAVLAAIVVARESKESSSSEEKHSEETTDFHHHHHGKFHHHHGDHPHRHHHPHFRHHHHHHHDQHHEYPRPIDRFTTTSTTTTENLLEEKITTTPSSVFFGSENQPDYGGIDLRATRTTAAPPGEEIDELLTTAVPVHSTTNANAISGLEDIDSYLSGNEGIFQTEQIKTPTHDVSVTTSTHEPTLNLADSNLQGVNLDQILSGTFLTQENPSTIASTQLDHDQIFNGSK